MNDQILYCRDCGREFLFTVGEQEFYTRHELINPPGRCVDCRVARRQGSGGAQNGGDGRGQNGGERVYYQTICAGCGQSTQVPFLPRPGGRPVYCNACYQLQPRGAQQRSRW
ncbi:MAG TPA: zinc-ribbon domain containing protein [Ktedonobacteraceae bacterium]